VSDRDYKKSGQEPKRPNFWKAPADQEKQLAFSEVMQILNGPMLQQTLRQDFSKRK